MGRIAVEDRGALRVLTLDHPARRNALDDAMLEELAAAIDPSATSGVRAFLVRGDEKAFCAGYDLTSLAAVAEGAPLPDARLSQVLTTLERHPSPSVALVLGPAFGAGCELAAACDFRVGGPGAVFCMPPARLGIVYAPSGIHRFLTLLGRGRTKRLFLTGCKVDAETALDWGLLDELHPADAERAALALCDELLGGAPLAVRGMKLAIEALSELSLEPAAAARIESMRRDAFNSEDAREARAAFLEKRKPRFQGR